MKYCEDCKYLTRYGSGIAGDYAVCALTKYVVIGKSYACDDFIFKKLTTMKYICGKRTKQS